MTTRCYVVRGRVQGVGFRWFVARQARRLDLRGFARNLEDGSVEVVAQGGDPALDEFARQLANGPALSHVVSVENTDVPHDMQRFSTFDAR